MCWESPFLLSLCGVTGEWVWSLGHLPVILLQQQSEMLVQQGRAAVFLGAKYSRLLPGMCVCVRPSPG